MLQTIREKTQGWIAGTIISIIILSFALWGVHSYFAGNGGNPDAASVNGVDISKEQLASAFERLRRQSQVQTATPLNPKDEIILKERALKSLIDIEILKQASLKQGFLISDQQVDDYLQNMSDFQVDGQFSIDRFQEVLSTAMLSTSEFLDIIKTSLQIDQPRLGIAMTAFSLPEESEYTASLVNQVRDINALNLSMTSFLNQPIAISPEAIAAYYHDHQNEYKTPEQVSVTYVELSLSDLYSRFHPTDTVLKAFYNENISAYTQSSATPKILPFESVKAKVREAYVRQQAEEKFAQLRDQLADLAYEHPDSLEAVSTQLNLPVKTSGLFAQSSQEKPSADNIAAYKKVRDAAFSNDVMNLQTNSDVIELNPETVVVIRVKSHVPSALLPLKDVSKQITDKLKVKAADVMALKFATDLTANLRAGVDINKLLETHHLQWTRYGVVGRYAKNVDSAILENAFQLAMPKNGKQSYGITRIPNGYAIVAVNNVKSGSSLSAKEEAVFNEQVQNSMGYLEYNLYREAQIKQAKVKIY